MANDIKLQEGHPVDENLRPLKVGGKSTAIETAQHGNGARINGDLEVTGNMKNIKSNSLTIDDSGDIILDVSGGALIIKKDGAVCSILKAEDLSSNFHIFEKGGATLDDYFLINVADKGATTLYTVDGDGTDADLTLDADGAVAIESSTSDSITLDAGANISLDATSSGVSTGILFKNAGTLIGDVTVHHSATFLRLYENGGASGDDHLSIYCSASGSSTIQTTDAGGANAHLNITVDGDITFNSASGKFIVENAGTEFSAPNSAYAGMILGYRCIGESGGHASYTLTTGFAVPDSDMTVRFIAPPSGAVEIMVQVFCNASTSNRIIYFGLSDNATYNTLGASYEQVVYLPDETDDNVVQNYWTITGLTAGDTYSYWFGAKTSGTTAYLNWGGTSTGRYPDFIMKATALPAAHVDFAIYG